MKNVQDEMLKGESSGQIFAVVHLGQYVKLAMQYLVLHVMHEHLCNSFREQTD